MNIQLLEAAKDFIVEDANQRGVSLAEIFGTPERFRHAVVSMVIVTIMDKLGCPVEDAYDMVMGDGSYQRLLDECWAELSGEVDGGEIQDNG